MSSNELRPQLDQVVTDLVTDAGLVEGIGADQYAAVDLGSNSFHLMISRYQLDSFTVLDRQREVVRLAAGLNEEGMLEQEVAERALVCLRKFGQLLRHLPPENVRVVGTNALRRLRNKNQFLERAEKALGHSIEIIAGREEARLIYLGVCKWSALGEGSRLVIDIGGGSTEVIVGKGDTPLCRESLEIGCVVLSKRFFADGKMTASRFEKAKMAAELAIQPVVSQFRALGWNEVIGCSGTMKALANALISNGWSKDGLHREGLALLLQHALKAKHIDNLELPSLTRDRRPVFAGGLAILLALFEQFDIRRMSVSEIALREGVLYDLVGRRSSTDIRNQTVAALLNLWSVDQIHGQQVRQTAIDLYSQVAAQWDIQDKLYADILGWAAELHELGLLISHDGFHKHGAYVVKNADMAGFARRDQLLLAVLLHGHRRKFALQEFEDLPSVLVTPAKRLAVILRLSVLLHRGRGERICQNLHLEVQGQRLELHFDEGWLPKNPLTVADLRQEQSWLKTIGVKLSFS